MKNKIKKVLCLAVLACSLGGCSHVNPDELQTQLYNHGQYVSKHHGSGLIDYTYKIIEDGDKKLIYITGGYEHQREMNEIYNPRLNDSGRYPDRPAPLIINIVTPKDNGKYDVIQIFDDVEVYTRPFLLLAGWGFYGKLGLNESKKDKAYLFKDIENIVDPASESIGKEMSIKEVKKVYNKSCQTLESYFEKGGFK